MRIEYTFWEFILTILLLVSSIRLFIVLIAYKELQKKLSELSGRYEMLASRSYI